MSTPERDGYPARDRYYTAFLEWKLATQEYDAASKGGDGCEPAGDERLRSLASRVMAAENALRQLADGETQLGLEEVHASPPRDKGNPPPGH